MTRTHTRINWRLMGAAAAVSVTLLLAMACGSSDDSERASGRPADVAGGQVQSGDAAAPGSSGEAPTGSGINGSGITGGDNSTSPGTLPAVLDEMVIRTATVTLETEEVSARFEDVGNIATGAGGFVASSTFGNANDRQTASVTVRIPGERYQDVINQLRKLGDVRGEQSNADNVSGQYTDLESRLRNLRATEVQYLEFLTRAGDISEVLTVQDRLNSVRGEIEQVQGRLQLLANQTSLATITVHMSPPLAGKADEKDGGLRSPLEVAEEAFEASLAVLLGIAVVLIAVAAFSWWLVPVGVVAYVIIRRQTQANRTS